MADSLRFKGVKKISQHTGTELQLIRPKRGGDIHQVRQWWGLKHRVLYTGCAVFLADTSFGQVYLVIPTDNETTELQIMHDGEGNFSFPYIRGVDRVAVYSTDYITLYREYQFSKISGGATVTRIVQGYPSGPAPETTIGVVTVTGATTATAGTASTYSVSVDGDAGNLSYQWSSSDGAAVFSAETAATTDVTFSGADTVSVSCEVTSADDNPVDSPATGTLEGIVVAVPFETRAANASTTHVVTVADSVYVVDGSPQPDLVGTIGEGILFDLSDASMVGHPMRIYTSAAKTTEVTVGVEIEGDQLLFTPLIAGTYSYQCPNHENMGGTLTIS